MEYHSQPHVSNTFVRNCLKDMERSRDHMREAMFALHQLLNSPGFNVEDENFAGLVWQMLTPSVRAAFDLFCVSNVNGEMTQNLVSLYHFIRMQYAGHPEAYKKQTRTTLVSKSVPAKAEGVSSMP